MSDLQQLFSAGVEAVKGRQAVFEFLTHNSDESADALGSSVWLAAVGKAASSMCEGARDALGERLQRALVITKYDHTDENLRTDSRFNCLESAHPVPDQASLDAGDALTAFVGSVPADATLLVLVSGGASSLVEKLPASMTLADLSRVNEYLLANGLDIGSMNRVRKSISCIKGGRLAHCIGQTPVLQLAISDVPGDSLEIIGSGLLAGASGDTQNNELELPGWLQKFQSQVPAAPSHSDPVFARVSSRIVASSGLAQEAVKNRAGELGYTVHSAASDLNDDVNIVACQISEILGSTESATGVYCWGGEPTLVLPDAPGRGGRNQHLALLLAKALDGKPGVEVLCCGTDGTDGPTGDAGGQVDAATLSKGRALGLDVDDYLERADAGNYLQQVDALVTTGPTGTNVMDLVIATKSG